MDEIAVNYLADLHLLESDRMSSRKIEYTALNNVTQ